METKELILELKIAAMVDPRGRAGTEVKVEKSLCAEAADHLEKLERKYNTAVELAAIATEKAAEADQVVHAHWRVVREENVVDGAGNPVYHVECSACGFVWTDVRMALRSFKGCPGCRAKMDEEVAV